MNNQKISLIIPCRNSEKTLKKCLDSVLSQTYKNYEVIVVDNNSIDNTKNIIEKFQKNNDGIKYFFESKISRGAARNCGVNNCSGYIVAMTDSDCIVPADWLEKLTWPILKNSENMAMGFEKEAMVNFWTESIQKREQNYRNSETAGGYIERIDTKNFAIKSEIIKKFMFDENLVFCEDVDLYLRIKMQTKFKIACLQSAKVLHFHQSTFAGLAKKEFNRGYWTKKIYDKYNDKKLLKMPVFKSLSLASFIKFPAFLLLLSFKMPLKEYIFNIISEVSWRAGALTAILNF